MHQSPKARDRAQPHCGHETAWKLSSSRLLRRRRDTQRTASQHTRAQAAHTGSWRLKWLKGGFSVPRTSKTRTNVYHHSLRGGPHALNGAHSSSAGWGTRSSAARRPQAAQPAREITGYRERTSGVRRCRAACARARAHGNSSCRAGIKTVDGEGAAPTGVRRQAALICDVALMPRLRVAVFVSQVRDSVGPCPRSNRTRKRRRPTNRITGARYGPLRKVVRRSNVSTRGRRSGKRRSRRLCTTCTKASTTCRGRCPWNGPISILVRALSNSGGCGAPTCVTSAPRRCAAATVDWTNGGEVFTDPDGVPDLPKAYKARTHAAIVAPRRNAQRDHPRILRRCAAAAGSDSQLAARARRGRAAAAARHRRRAARLVGWSRRNCSESGRRCRAHGRLGSCRARSVAPDARSTSPRRSAQLPKRRAP